MNFAFYTLGCKVNQYETQALEQLTIEKGHIVSNENIDAFIVNTCTVTSVSDKKNLKIIRKAKKENPNAIIAVCGCFAQTHARELENLDYIDIICGTDKRSSVIDLCIDFYNNHNKINNVSSNIKKEFEYLPAGTLDSRTRGLLKVQDGCDNFCTYCIIPYARGRIRSLDMETAINEAIKLEKEGIHEIVITGIEISSYGKDLENGENLTKLISSICKAVPTTRIRLGSLDPRTITKDFCENLYMYDNLCPHFHLSMQSGCDYILSKMNRKYKSADFYNSVKLVNDYFPNASVTTDFIVGFPSESETHFNESLDFIKSCNFASMHIFPYSIREGTIAAKMENQIDIKVKTKRAEIAKEVSDISQKQYLEKFIGKELCVLTENNDGEFWSAHSKYYFTVKFIGANISKNTFVNVKIKELTEDGLTAHLLA